MVTKQGIKQIPKGKKWCPWCQTAKSRSDFGPHKVNKDGLAGHCRSCKAEQQLEYQKRNKEKVNENVRNWYHRNGNGKQSWENKTKANPDLYRASGRKRRSKYRARLKKAFVEDIDPLVVYERDEGICGICGQFIYPDEKFDIDHIIPLAKKGTHSYSNAQLAHIRCNRWKSGRMVVVENDEWFFKKKKDEDSFGRFLERL
jgi:5-methylcytosine-specific restriction endonuclease McrA